MAQRIMTLYMVHVLYFWVKNGVRATALYLLFLCSMQMVGGDGFGIESNWLYTVANKWILLFDQLLRRKCSLQPHQRFQIPVNGKVRKDFLLIAKVYPGLAHQWRNSYSECFDNLRLSFCSVSVYPCPV